MSEGFIGLSSKKKTIKETDSDTKMLIPVLAELGQQFRVGGHLTEQGNMTMSRVIALKMSFQP
ncbi:hypothetical protein APICC_02356 [Apis cerana cerana]|uniref:Uncharacterized protein n=1 Tax=Apis cerana cerana TaxID=94128 RepID=A0A2A3ESA1_APICC|nr:hypothetical protein APICC_02356 [Apis cerana cerana]